MRVYLPIRSSHLASLTLLCAITSANLSTPRTAAASATPGPLRAGQGSDASKGRGSGKMRGLELRKQEGGGRGVQGSKAAGGERQRQGDSPERGTILKGGDWIDYGWTELPLIPDLVQEQMSESDWRDVERLLNLKEGEMSAGAVEPEAAGRVRGRGRLLTEWLRQRLVLNSDGTTVPVPELYPQLFEEADALHDLQDGYVRQSFADESTGGGRSGSQSPLRGDAMHESMKSSEAGKVNTRLIRIEDSDVAGFKAKDSRLWIAAEEGDAEGVREAVKGGADLESGDPRLGFWTALHRASHHGETGCVQLLLKMGADPNAPTKAGYTPMHVAAFADQAAVIDALASGGGDVNAVDDDNLDTPLHSAAEGGSVSAARALVNLGASLSATNVNGQAPCEAAEANAPSAPAWEGGGGMRSSRCFYAPW